MTLNGVGVVCALVAEARHLGPRLERLTAAQPAGGQATGSACPQITTLHDGTLLAVSGMGAPAAHRAAEALISRGARALASWGMAGGLDPALEAGTICLPDEVMGQDGICSHTTRPWCDTLSSAVGDQQSLHRGRLLTTAAPVSSPAQKAALFAQTGAAAVDMESAAIGQVAGRSGLPFIAVRVIVDAANDSLPRAVMNAADAAGRIRLWQLVGSLARAPADLAPVLRLARRYQCASRSLAAVARSGRLARDAFSCAAESLHA